MIVPQLTASCMTNRIIREAKLLNVIKVGGREIEEKYSYGQIKAIEAMFIKYYF